MNNFELKKLIDETVHRELTRIEYEILSGIIGIDEVVERLDDATYDWIDALLTYPVGGYDTYSPFNEPLVRTITLSDVVKNDAGRAVRRARMDWNVMK